jgi:dTMP kinase
MIDGKRGRLIVFEGVEGAGKSTQLDRLVAQLARAGVPHKKFREPGGTSIGDVVRDLVLNPRWSVSPRAEALLYMASRAELVACEVAPALADGMIVLLDRFFLSTYAYQIAGRGLPESDVRSANVMATNGLVPDLTVLLTLGADVGLERAKRRGEADRIEQSGREFHARVEQAFAEFATREWQSSHEECGPIIAVDASGSPDAVETRVLDVVTTRFHELRALAGAAA